MRSGDDGACHATPFRENALVQSPKEEVPIDENPWTILTSPSSPHHPHLTILTSPSSPHHPHRCQQAFMQTRGMFDNEAIISHLVLEQRREKGRMLLLACLLLGIQGGAAQLAPGIYYDQRMYTILSGMEVHINNPLRHLVTPTRQDCAYYCTADFNNCNGFSVQSLAPTQWDCNLNGLSSTKSVNMTDAPVVVYYAAGTGLTSVPPGFQFLGGDSGLVYARAMAPRLNQTDAAKNCSAAGGLILSDDHGPVIHQAVVAQARAMDPVFWDTGNTIVHLGAELQADNRTWMFPSGATFIPNANDPNQFWMDHAPTGEAGRNCLFLVSPDGRWIDWYCSHMASFLCAFVLPELDKGLQNARDLYHQLLDLDTKPPSNVRKGDVVWTKNGLQNILRTIEWDLKDLEDSHELSKKNARTLKLDDSALEERRRYMDEVRTEIAGMRERFDLKKPNDSASRSQPRPDEGEQTSIPPFSLLLSSAGPSRSRKEEAHVSLDAGEDVLFQDPRHPYMGERTFVPKEHRRDGAESYLDTTIKTVGGVLQGRRQWAAIGILSGICVIVITLIFVF
ncbi:unnamed protein product [Darwinula stevensoni]|uniref:Syntaxin 6/10/61 N-terminal domain-containing protein n=1 Tax=Darwinula stevensoni TaxID=69355 RepID=A0A7R8X756_9CRUS|nr:unnamed protein product [Darwinula stevensoni]CAG0882828.1 unnamed protein product [Darwinula stevensoni]